MRARDLGRRGRRLAHIPLANTGTSSFENIEMDMVTVIAVSAWSQHRRKAMTGGIPQTVTKRFCNGLVGEVCAAIARQDQSTDIDGITLAVFA